MCRTIVLATPMPEAVTSKLPCRHLSRFICLHHAKQIPSSRKHASEACQPCKSHQSTKQQLTSACSADTNMIQHAVPAVQSSDLVAACTRQQRHVSRRELLQVAASAALLLQAAPKAQVPSLSNLQLTDKRMSKIVQSPCLYNTALETGIRGFPITPMCAALCA